jgi:hypothetical protein
VILISRVELLCAVKREYGLVEVCWNIPFVGERSHARSEDVIFV